MKLHSQTQHGKSECGLVAHTCAPDPKVGTIYEHPLTCPQCRQHALWLSLMSSVSHGLDTNPCISSFYQISLGQYGKNLLWLLPINH